MNQRILAKPENVRTAKMLDDGYPVIDGAKLSGVSTTAVIEVRQMRQKAA